VELYDVFGRGLWLNIIRDLRDYSEEFSEVRVEIESRESIGGSSKMECSIGNREPSVFLVRAVIG